MTKLLTVNPTRIKTDNYTPVWHKGTGLPSSLPPGDHVITDGWMRDGQEYVSINDDFYTTRDHVRQDSY